MPNRSLQMDYLRQVVQHPLEGIIAVIKSVTKHHLANDIGDSAV